MSAAYGPYPATITIYTSGVMTVWGPPQYIAALFLSLDGVSFGLLIQPVTTDTTTLQGQPGSPYSFFPLCVVYSQSATTTVMLSGPPAPRAA